MKTNTRENIKGCFLELLEESPFSHITVKDIVERCAINRNTFYYYFQDMAALAEAVAIIPPTGSGLNCQCGAFHNML